MVFFILPDKQQPTKTPIHSPNPANIPNAARSEGLPGGRIKHQLISQQGKNEKHENKKTISKFHGSPYVDN